MTSKFIITDDDNGNDLTEKEHFQVSYQKFSGFDRDKHYELLDQVVTHLLAEVDSTVKEVVIRRMCNRR